MTTRDRERRLRNYASHLALKVQGSDPFTLVTKYGKRRKVAGPYHSLNTLERGIVRFNEKCIVNDTFWEKRAGPR
jgi:hypothetical protein